MGQLGFEEAGGDMGWCMAVNHKNPFWGACVQGVGKVEGRPYR